MARPLRLQFPGGHYHVISRGNNRKPVFCDDVDRAWFLHTLDRVSTRLDWRILAYCLMNNHYHLFLETPGPSLARGMRDLNGSYAQAFNRRHGCVGHVFQARYKSILVERSSYFLELARYIVLNPVRAGLCGAPDEWQWSSHRAMLGLAPRLAQLAVDRMFGTIDVDASSLRESYAAFVDAGLDEAEPRSEVRNTAILGSEAFVRDVIDRIPAISLEVTRKDRTSRPLRRYEDEATNRDDAIRSAYASGAYSLTEIARYFKLHLSTVSKICRVR